MGVPLPRIHIDRLSFIRLGQHPIRLDDGQAMPVNRILEVGVACHLDDTHAVTLARLNSDDGNF